MWEAVTKGRFYDVMKHDGFSYDGANALYDFIIESEDQGLYGERGCELDPVEIRSEFTEYYDFEELQKDYPEIKREKKVKDVLEVITFQHYDTKVTGYIVRE